MSSALQAVAVLGLVASSCGSTDATWCQRFLDDNPSGFGRGQVVVSFEDTVQTEADAVDVVQEAGFSVTAFYSSSLALVSVPAGAECVAIDRLEGHPAIEDAYPQVIVYAQ